MTVPTGSHHEPVYNSRGEKIGHLRITNAGKILSAWIHKQFLKMEFDEKYVSKLTEAEE